MVDFDLFGPFSELAVLNLEMPEELADVWDVDDDLPVVRVERAKRASCVCDYRKHARRYSRGLLLQHQWEALVGYAGYSLQVMTGEEFVSEQLYLTCHTEAEFERGWWPLVVRARELGFVLTT